MSSSLETPFRLRPIRSAFALDGFNHRLIQRQKDVAICEKQKFFPIVPFCLSYEVVRILSGKPIHFDPERDLYDLVERYPSNEQWGTHGFSSPTLKTANARFKALQRSASMPRAHAP
jgi:hypothetical protein